MSNDYSSTYLESYERLLWNLLCRRQQLRGRFSANKAKRLAIMAYCLYYRGITISQIMLAKMSDSTDAAVVRATMSKYATSDIRCSVLSKKHLSDDVSGLAEVSASDAKKPYFVYQLLHGKKKINVYELSEYGLNKSIYELLELPSEFLSGVSRADLGQMVRQYRKRKSLQLSDEAAHLLAARDIGAFCYSVMDFRPFVYRTECRFFENGEFMRSVSGSRHAALASTAQISDGYLEYISVSRVSSQLQSVYIEQDMGTQSRSYIRKNKLLRYMNFMRYSFQKNPALTTLLFSLQTRANFQYRQASASSNSQNASSYLRYAPALRQEIMIRAGEIYGARWKDVLLSDFRDRTADTLRYCPQVRTHLQNELLLFDRVLNENAHVTISELLSLISVENRKEHPASISFTVNDHFYYKQRRLEIFEESLRISGFKDILLEGFSVMFIPNNDLSTRIPCLLAELSGIRQGTGDPYPRSQANHRLCQLISRVASCQLTYMDYLPFVDAQNRLFRNYYFNDEERIHVVVENISDDLGGRTRVLDYLQNPASSPFNGYLVCLAEDDWMDPVKRPVRQRPSDFLWPEIASSTYAQYLIDYQNGDYAAHARLSLRVLFITYSTFLDSTAAAGVVELAATTTKVFLKKLEV